MDSRVKIIGGGLAGSEAALYLAERSIKVDLYEMRPVKTTPVHKTSNMAELVCSNSLGSFHTTNASGLLKEEISRLGSHLIPIAKEFSVPAGNALAVDRELFATEVTNKIKSHGNITIITEHVQDLRTLFDDQSIILVASGPLTSPEFANSLLKLTGQEYLHFYDAVAPIVEYESINMSIAYKLDRYCDAESSSYINCPMNREEYEAFYNFLIEAPTIELKEFEKESAWFEGCMPVEVIGKRGRDTLRFGPMKPVGLINPHNNELPYAVVQLRQDNAIASLYNLVGFQTNLKWSAQKELLRLIPGLEDASIVRYGVMHGNIYINSPVLLNSNLESKFRPELYFAGQITGVEGYTESIATGLLAGINIYRKINGCCSLEFDDRSILGSLVKYITGYNGNNFQPMNSNWGIIRPLDKKIKDKKQRYQAYADRALEYLSDMLD